MSEVEGVPAPELEVDDADLLEQATPVPADDDEEYPFGPEDDQAEPATAYGEDDDLSDEEEA